MLSFLLKQIWIGTDDFLLYFFATFDLVLGLQVTVTFGSVLELQVNTGFSHFFFRMSSNPQAIPPSHSNQQTPSGPGNIKSSREFGGWRASQ